MGEELTRVPCRRRVPERYRLARLFGLPDCVIYATADRFSAALAKALTDSIAIDLVITT